MVIGPALEVSTNDAKTVDWFHENLLVEQDQSVVSQPPETHRQHHDSSIQSEYGILVKVDAQPGTSVATEILFYTSSGGVENAPSKRDEGVSGSMEDEKFAQPVTWKVYALLLCSEILKRLNDTFLPRVSSITETKFASKSHEESPSVQRREKLAALFEDATQQRRRLKGRGGERISKAMADSSVEVLWKDSWEEQCPGVNGQVSRKNESGARRLSTKSTSASFASKQEIRRRLSAHESQESGGRISLQRMKEAASTRQSSLVPESDGDVEIQNKAALAKVVMAGMRLHGIQNKKKLPKDATDLMNLREPWILDDDNVDEYKTVYHQTFKAASFAFRSHLNARLINQGAMRDVVDQLLEIFCTDPMAVHELDQGFGSTSKTGQLETSHYFDLPSSNMRPDENTVNWATPSKRRLDKDI